MRRSCVNAACSFSIGYRLKSYPSLWYPNCVMLPACGSDPMMTSEKRLLTPASGQPSYAKNRGEQSKKHRMQHRCGMRSG